MRAFTISFLILTGISLYGQESPEKFNAGGISISNGVSWAFGGIEETMHPGYGFAASAFYEGKFKKWFGLESGVEYSNIGYKMEDPENWIGNNGGIFAFDTEFFPEEDPVTGAWNPMLPISITEWEQEKRTGLMSIYVKPNFYLPTEKADLYLFAGVSEDFVIHQYTRSKITSSEYPVWEDSFREPVGTHFKSCTVGFMGGIGVEKQVGEHIRLKAELINKVFGVIKVFNDGEDHDWYINYPAIKLGVLFTGKADKAMNNKQ